MKRPNPTPESIRKARGNLTQEQAATLIGYSRRSWQSWEGGQRTMRAITMDAFRSAVAYEKQKRGDQ